MLARCLLRFELTVGDLAAAERFHAGLPGVVVTGRDRAEPAMAALLGAERIEQCWLRRGEQTIVLQAFTPAGRAYPDVRQSCDQGFQHLALPVAEARAGLPPGAVTISRGGAQTLPARSGGAIALKFRDPEGHPLELIQFADGDGGGVDHSAIVSADVERSIAFYRDTLGLSVTSRQTNRGPEQDRLDGLNGVVVDVVALSPAVPTPHVELLAYRTPPVRPAGRHAAADIAATRLVFEVEGLDGGTRLADGSAAALMRDPDGHLLLLLVQPPG